MPAISFHCRNTSPAIDSVGWTSEAHPPSRPRPCFFGAIFGCGPIASPTRFTRLLLVWLALSGLGVVFAAAPESSTGAALLDKYTSLADRLQQNSYQRPLYLDSTESGTDIEGDIYAVVDYPFATVNAGLNDPDNWCDVLSLHLNTKYCRVTSENAKTMLRVSIGKKFSQPLEDAYTLEFTYRVTASTAKYLEIQLSAEKGPMGTRNYRIQVQAIPLANGRTFLHMTYFYAYGWAGRIAMKTYLATIGSGKVGFTVTRRQGNGQPEYIRGMRGLVERNAMRYYLAIDAYLGASAAPPSQQLQKRLQAWFTATEQYPRQLHEMERSAYIGMKLTENLRQRTMR